MKRIGSRIVHRRVWTIRPIPSCVRPLLISLAEETYQKAFTIDGLICECKRDRVDTTRVWWVQTEALTVFLIAFEKTEDVLYRRADENPWRYIRDVMVDPHPVAERYWCTDEQNLPIPAKPIVKPWKGPYHNGRMALDVIERSRYETI